MSPGAAALAWLLLAAAALPRQPAPAPQATPTPPQAVPQPRAIALPNGAIAYIPAGAGAHPPLLVLLHGADHRPGWMIERLARQADKRGIVLLAPSSQGGTWDAVTRAKQPPSRDSPLVNANARRFTGGRDAARVEAAIAALGQNVPVDRARTVLAGFSDGATYALALGMSRAHAFAAVIAWSPGIALETPAPARGRRVFVSHGRQDPILPYATDCAEILPNLRTEGAALTFLPFEGVHQIPEAAVDAFLDAAFGPVAGEAAHPLPAGVPSCRAQGVREE
jgi:phospholipase/carboxylesterase